LLQRFLAVFRRFDAKKRGRESFLDREKRGRESFLGPAYFRGSWRFSAGMK
jgi:hypothetical protein